MTSDIGRSACTVAASLTAAVTWSIWCFTLACAASADGRDGQPPLLLAKEGNFYVGGSQVARGQGMVHVDQMYVEYQVPARQVHRYPLIMVHGGDGTGAIYGGTPDDREGWREFFARAGYAVYVVDTPTAGRSAWRSVGADLRGNQALRLFETYVLHKKSTSANHMFRE